MKLKMLKWKESKYMFGNGKKGELWSEAKIGRFFLWTWPTGWQVCIGEETVAQGTNSIYNKKGIPIRNIDDVKILQKNAEKALKEIIKPLIQ